MKIFRCTREQKRAVYFILSTLFLMRIITFTFQPVMADDWVLIWEEWVHSTGVEVVSPVLKNGMNYRIVATEIWGYNAPANLAADAQYYTTDPSDAWNWGNHFPAPGGHSFLQINGEDVDWGPFSNGDTGHTYTIYYTGEGSTITFKIVDWVDLDYGNNFSHIPVKIYKPRVVGGFIVEPNPLKIVTFWTTSATLAVFITVLIRTRARK